MGNLQNKYGIVLDGKMDEPIWQTVEVHTGFQTLNSQGGELLPWQTFFKILPCEDRVYVGVHCEEGGGLRPTPTSAPITIPMADVPTYVPSIPWVNTWMISSI